MRVYQLQKRALGIINKSPYLAHTNPLSRKVEGKSSVTSLQPLDETLRTPLLIKEHGDINKSAICIQPLMKM